MKDMIRPALLSFLVICVLCGIAYPALGCLVPQRNLENRLAQNFEEDGHMWAAPMDMVEIDGAQYALPSTQGRDEAQLQQYNPGIPVPAELVVPSASGLDPHIHKATALWQVPRISQATGIPEGDLEAMVEEMTDKGLVNTVEFNRALDTIGA